MAGKYLPSFSSLTQWSNDGLEDQWFQASECRG